MRITWEEQQSHHSYVWLRAFDLDDSLHTQDSVISEVVAIQEGVECIVLMDGSEWAPFGGVVLLAAKEMGWIDSGLKAQRICPFLLVDSLIQNRSTKEPVHEECLMFRSPDGSTI